MKGVPVKLDFVQIILGIATIATPTLIAWQIYLKMKESYPTVHISHEGKNEYAHIYSIKICPSKDQFTFTKISSKNAYISILTKPRRGIYGLQSPHSHPVKSVEECLFSVPPSSFSEAELSMQIAVFPINPEKRVRISLHVDSVWPWARISKRILITKQTD